MLVNQVDRGATISNVQQGVLGGLHASNSLFCPEATHILLVTFYLSESITWHPNPWGLLSVFLPGPWEMEAKQW